MPDADKRRIALVVLVGFALIGEQVLSVMGITLPAFRVAGGLLLFWIAFERVFERRQERKSERANRSLSEDNLADIAAFPLAVPLDRFLSATVRTVVTRLLGVILAALSVQFVADGVRELANGAV